MEDNDHDNLTDWEALLKDQENEVLLSQHENLTGEAGNGTIAAMMSTMNENLQLLLKRSSLDARTRKTFEKQRLQPSTATENKASEESDSKNLINEHSTEVCTGEAWVHLNVTNNDKSTSEAGKIFLTKLHRTRVQTHRLFRLLA